MNKTKALGELFNLVVKLNDVCMSAEFKRWTPQAKEVTHLLADMLGHCAEAIRQEEPVMFELMVWQQMTFAGALFEIGVPDSESDVTEENFSWTDEAYGRVE